MAIPLQTYDTDIADIRPDTEDRLGLPAVYIDYHPNPGNKIMLTLPELEQITAAVRGQTQDPSVELQRIIGEKDTELAQLRMERDDYETLAKERRTICDMLRETVDLQRKRLEKVQAERDTYKTQLGQTACALRKAREELRRAEGLPPVIAGPASWNDEETYKETAVSVGAQQFHGPFSDGPSIFTSAPIGELEKARPTVSRPSKAPMGQLWKEVTSIRCDLSDAVKNIALMATQLETLRSQLRDIAIDEIQAVFLKRGVEAKQAAEICLYNTAAAGGRA